VTPLELQLLILQTIAHHAGVPPVLIDRIPRWGVYLLWATGGAE
jgi:hypothetical protein